MLLHRNAAVFDVLDDLAKLASTSTARLRDLPGPTDLETQVEPLRSADEEARRLMQQVSERLAHAFQPPIQPEDIHHLANDLREIVEAVSRLAERLRLYRADAVSPELLKQIELLSEAARVVDQAIHALRARRRTADLTPAIAQIRGLRERAEDHYDAAISRLYDGSVPPLVVLEATELHELARSAMHLCDGIACTLECISVKNA